MSSPFDGLPDVFTTALGQTVTVVDALGRSREVQGIFRRPSASDLEMTFRTATLDLREADADQLHDGVECLVFIGEETFVLRAPEPDGKGMVKFPLSLRDPE